MTPQTTIRISIQGDRLIVRHDDEYHTTRSYAIIGLLKLVGAIKIGDVVEFEQPVKEPTP